LLQHFKAVLLAGPTERTATDDLYPVCSFSRFFMSSK